MDQSWSVVLAQGAFEQARVEDVDPPSRIGYRIVAGPLAEMAPAGVKNMDRRDRDQRESLLFNFRVLTRAIDFGSAGFSVDF
ncbi:hypothetical protein GPNCGGLF_LOCUS3142 [Methylorubrum aminovorans]